MQKIKINMVSWENGEKQGFETLDNSSIYYSSAKKLLNFLPTAAGPLVRRCGSNYLATLYNRIIPLDYKLKLTPGGAIKLLPFGLTLDGDTSSNNWTDRNNIILEFTSGLMRVYFNNQLLPTDNTYTTPYTMVTPYVTDEDINNLTSTFDFTNQVLYLFCPGFKPQLLSINQQLPSLPPTFKLTDFTCLDGPYMDINLSAITLTPSAKTGDITITASESLFGVDDIGRQVRLFHDPEWGWAIITGFTNPTRVSAMVQKDFTDTTATQFWRMGAFSDKLGYPGLGLIFNNRLYLANNGSNSNTVWVSCYNDYTNFAPTKSSAEYKLFDSNNDVIAATNAITTAIDLTGQITFMHATSNYVLIGSTSGVFILAPTNYTSAISPYNFKINKLTSIGTKKKGIFSGNQSCLFYASSSNGKAADQLTCIQTSGFTTKEVISNVFPSDYNSTNTNITQITLQPANSNILNVLLSDGRLVFCSLSAERFGFSSVALGGDSPSILANTANQKALYLVVQREGSYAEKQETIITAEYINWYALQFENIDESIIYLDCSSSYTTSNPTNTFNNIEGLMQAVSVIADGIYIGELILGENGYINLPVLATSITVGYSYTSIYTSPNIINNQNLASVSAYTKISQIAIEVINSSSGYLCSCTNLTDQLTEIATPDFANLQAGLFSGVRVFNTNFSWQIGSSFSIVASSHLPFNLAYLQVTALIS